MKRAILCVFLLGACTDQAIIAAAYPDREKFAFRSLDGESIFSYTCAASDNTKSRASEAHTYLDRRLNAAVDGAADRIVEGGDRSRARAIARALDTEIEDIVEQTEARYQCLFIQARDT